jgi:hypothetical protein
LPSCWAAIFPGSDFGPQLKNREFPPERNVVVEEEWEENTMLWQFERNDQGSRQQAIADQRVPTEAMGMNMEIYTQPLDLVSCGALTTAYRFRSPAARNKKQRLILERIDLQIHLRYSVQY